MALLVSHVELDHGNLSPETRSPRDPPFSGDTARNSRQSGNHHESMSNVVDAVVRVGGNAWVDTLLV